MRHEGGKLGAQAGVMIVRGADEDAVSRFVAGGEAEHKLAVEVDGFRAEHRAEHEGGLRFQGLPEPLVRVYGFRHTERITTRRHRAR